MQSGAGMIIGAEGEGMSNCKFGVYGIGDVAGEYIKAIDNNPDGEVAAVVGRDMKKTEGRIHALGLDCDVLDSYDEMIARDDIDAVVITTPHFLHAAEAIRAAEEGKHIVCEKPIGMTLEEMRSVRDAVKKADVVFQNGLVLRWSPFIQNVLFMRDKGLLGEIYYMECDYFHGLGPWWNGFTWGVHKKSGGPSAALVGGIHAADLLRCICGDIVEVHAYAARGHRQDFEYVPTYMATVKFENGAVGKTSCSYEIESPYMVNTIVHGSGGSVHNDRFYSKGLFPGQTGWERFETIMPDSPAVSHHPFRFLIDDFMEGIKTGRSTVLNIDETYKTHELCVAIDRSMEEGQPVKLPLG